VCTIREAARRYGTSEKAIQRGVKRLLLDGHNAMFPTQRGQKEGVPVPAKQGSTPEENAAFVDAIVNFPPLGGTPTVNKVKKQLIAKGALSDKAARLKRRTWATRLKEVGVVAVKGWNKRVYSPEEKVARVTAATALGAHPASYWRDTVFVDEVDVPHCCLKNREGYLMMMREFTYKQKGVKLDERHAIPRGKSVKDYLCSPKDTEEKLESKFCCGIMDGEVIVYRPCQSYVKFGGPPPPRPPQPVSKNGVKLGRKRKPENEHTTEKKGSFCGRHWGDFLGQIAECARRKKGWGPRHLVRVYQDNLLMHYCPAAKEAAKLHRVVFVGEAEGVRPPTHSPDLNPIEKLFSKARAYLLEEEVIEPAITREVTMGRFEEFCRIVPPADVRALTDRAPKAFAAVVAAKGGPTPG